MSAIDSAKRLEKSIRQVYKNAFRIPPRIATPKRCDPMDEFRPRCFIDVSLSAGGPRLGRLSIVLFPDIVPKTVYNFVELCENYKRQKNTTKYANDVSLRFPNYVGSIIYRVYPQLYIEMGDITRNNGTGGCAANGLPDFEPENFDIHFDAYAGMLAMSPDADGKLNSRFLITVKPLRVLNGERVCFGRVTHGFSVLQAIEKQARGYRLPDPLVISNCGILPQKKNNNE